MPRVVVIVGTNGCGKTTIVTQVMARFQPRPIYGALGPRFPEAYWLDIGGAEPLHVLGSYHANSGGTDWIGHFPTIMELVKKYRKRGHILFEGLIISGYKGQLGSLLDTYGKDSVVVCVDTPLDVCIERVRARRAKTGNEKELDPRNVIKKYEAAERTRKRYLKENVVTVLDVSVETGAEAILDLFKEEMVGSVG